MARNFTYTVDFHDKHKKTSSQTVLVPYEGMLKDIVDEFMMIPAHSQETWLASFLAARSSDPHVFHRKSSLVLLMPFYPAVRAWGYANLSWGNLYMLLDQKYPFTVKDCQFTAQNTKINSDLVRSMALADRGWGIRQKTRFHFVNTLHPDVLTPRLLSNVFWRAPESLAESPEGKLLLSHARRLLELDEEIPDSWVLRVL